MRVHRSVSKHCGGAAVSIPRGLNHHHTLLLLCLGLFVLANLQQMNVSKWAPGEGEKKKKKERQTSERADGSRILKKKKENEERNASSHKPPSFPPKPPWLTSAPSPSIREQM